MKSKTARGPKRKKKSVFSRYALVGLVCLFSLAFLGSYFFYLKINSQFAHADSLNYGSKTLMEYPILTYINFEGFDIPNPKIKEIKVLIFDKNAHKIVTYQIPINLIVDVPGVYGSEELSKVFSLATLNNNLDIQGGVEAINLVIFRMFGLKPEKYILDSQNVMEPFFTNGNYVPIVKLALDSSLKKMVYTNLTLKDLFTIGNFVSSLNKDRLVLRNLPYTYLENRPEIDEDIQDITYSSSLAVENFSIAVFNGSDLSGIAGFCSRVIKNMGGRVVSVGNTQKTYEQSYIVSQNPNSESVKFLAQTFEIRAENIISPTNTLLQNEDLISRADVVLLIGLDLKPLVE